MVCLGLEPGQAGSKVKTNPLSYGGTPISKLLCRLSSSFHHVTSLGRHFTSLVLVITVTSRGHHLTSVIGSSCDATRSSRDQSGCRYIMWQHWFYVWRHLRITWHHRLTNISCQDVSCSFVKTFKVFKNLKKVRRIASSDFWPSKTWGNRKSWYMCFT